MPSVDAYATHVLASHPLAYYRFDEAAGTTVAHDSSGHGHDCTYTSAVMLGAAGIVSGDTAMRLEQQGQGVVCAPTLFAFNGTAPFTVEGWYAPDSIGPAYQSGSSRVIASPRTGYYVFFHANPAAGASFEIFDAGNLRCSADDAQFPCAAGGTCGVLAHVVAEYDGATLFVYVNGALGASGACPQGLPDAGTVPFTIGNYTGLGCASCGMLGVIDELAVYDRALTPSEVQDHYAAAKQ
jgi:hypothetical protein